MDTTVRVRFAPSPTGHLHIGNARTAILNWVFARHAGGKFILRIEDTDVQRSTRESEASILADLRWLQLDWDEGPEVGGDYGPYRQSERLEIYRKYAEQLLRTERAYYCTYTAEELEAERAAAQKQGRPPRYRQERLSLAAAQQKARAKRTEPSLRFQVPDRAVRFRDLVKGELSFPADTFGDFVILRSDGTPTYNFAVVVDDHLMRITHVIRGDDHVSNSPRQIMLYEALGWPMPQFAHIPMILGEDRSRLSKRHGATAVDQFANQGYLPEALINFLSLLSWSSESGEEILSIDRLVREFSFSRINHSPAVFDLTKLNWMNGVYIRNLSVEQLLERCLPFLRRAGYPLPDEGTLKKMVALVQDKLERLEEVVEELALFFVDRVHITDGVAIATSQTESAEKVYWSFLRQLDEYEVLTAEVFRRIMKTVNRETGVMGKDLWMPIRIALTGAMHGPELPAIAEILGKEKVRDFIMQIVG